MTQKPKLGRVMLSDGFCMTFGMGSRGVPIFSARPIHSAGILRLFQRVTENGNMLDIVSLAMGYQVKAVFHMKELEGLM